MAANGSAITPKVVVCNSNSSANGQNVCVAQASPSPVETNVAKVNDAIGPLPSSTSFASAESTDYCLSGLFRSSRSNASSNETTTSSSSGLKKASTIALGPSLDRTTVSNDVNGKDSWTLFSDIGDITLQSSSAELSDYCLSGLFRQPTIVISSTEGTSNSPASMSWEPMSIETAWTEPIVRPRTMCRQNSLPNDVRLSATAGPSSVSSAPLSNESVGGKHLWTIYEADNQKTDNETGDGGAAKDRAMSDMRQRALQSEDLYEYVVKACMGTPGKSLTLSETIARAEEIFADYRALLQELADEQSA
ncbi:hypothetical protein AAVH_07787 [Aphelenchoides avenae]|nr:hypothetical protein AAVH_07787 [Aphelenchus avenae]